MKNKIDNHKTWKPKTLKEYRNLANEIYEYDWIDSVVQVFPFQYEIGWHASGFLKKAIYLIRQFRLPVSELSRKESGYLDKDECDIFWEVRQPWALAACSLWEYMESRFEYSFRTSKFCKDCWLRSPKVEGFGEIGAAALEVIEMFGCSVGEILYDTLQIACGKKGNDRLVYDFLDNIDLVLEPVLEPIATNWCKEIKKEIEKYFPSAEWPEKKIEYENRVLLFQLEYEIEQASKCQKETQRENNTTEGETTNIPEERRSSPLSLTRMAQYWGGDMTSKKLKALVKNGIVKVIKLNRQTYIFDTKYLPAKVINKIKR